MTHAPGTYSPGTADNAYGYSASVALSSARAVLNADSYALYANGLFFSPPFSLLSTLPFPTVFPGGFLELSNTELIFLIAIYVGC